jgi:hypothetical protein
VNEKTEEPDADAGEPDEADGDDNGDGNELMTADEAM